jgi:hypothetical protein
MNDVFQHLIATMLIDGALLFELADIYFITKRKRRMITRTEEHTSVDSGQVTTV